MPSRQNCKMFTIFNSAVFGNISNRTLSATGLNGGLPPLVQNNMSTSTLPSPWEELSLSNSEHNRLTEEDLCDMNSSLKYSSGESFYQSIMKLSMC